jgi:hypothetical protein
LTSNAPQSGTFTSCSGGTEMSFPLASCTVSLDFSASSRPLVASCLGPVQRTLTAMSTHNNSYLSPILTSNIDLFARRVVPGADRQASPVSERSASHVGRALWPAPSTTFAAGVLRMGTQAFTRAGSRRDARSMSSKISASRS